MTDETLFDATDLLVTKVDALDGAGQARADDPVTSKWAAAMIARSAPSDRVRLLRAHQYAAEGWTDDEAAMRAGLSMTSEYATRCSELRRMGALTDTIDTRESITGRPRIVRRITPYGLDILAKRWAVHGDL